MTKKTKIIMLSLLIGIVLIGSVAYVWQSAESKTAETTASATSSESSINLDDGDEDIDWDSLPTTNVTLTNETLTITTAGTYVLTGSTTAGVTVKSDGNVRIALNNANVKSSTGPAIYVESAKNTVIQLVAGTTNTVEDGTTHSDETLDGAIFSADDLIFDGTGTLNVTSNFADAIVSKDDLKITSGTFVITSVDDGIRGKDSVNIVDGTITINAKADGIKSTNDADAAKGYVYIHAGTITIDAGDDGIHAEQKIVIDNGTVDVRSSYEGIEAANITINDGTVTVVATNDGINAPASTLTSALITINGGTINVTVGSGDTDAIDSNGDVVINGGTITITAPTSSVDYDGTAEFNGGTLIVNGTQLSEIPEGMMGGGSRPL